MHSLLIHGAFGIIRPLLIMFDENFPAGYNFRQLKPAKERLTDVEVKKLNLDELMRKIKDGAIQLPDFQREWIWSDEQIKSLLESVIRRFPINSILFLECDADNLKFAFRPITGADETSAKPQYLILDGQQRLTSLYGALFSDKPVKIKKGKEYFYYVDMAKAIEVVKNSSDAEDIIISVPPSKKLKAKGKNWDLSTPEKEFEHGMFPLNKIFSSRQWLRAYEKFHGTDVAETLADAFDEKLVKKIESYDVAIVELKKNTSLNAVCKIFENVNRGISKLDTFDLLTSIFAAKTDDNGEPVRLRKDWEDIQAVFESMGLDILKAVDCSDFVTALTLFVSYRNRGAKNSVSCKGEDILKLKHKDYLQYKGDIIEGFIEASKFLEEDGITTTKYLPYKSQLIPMAAIFAELKAEGKDNKPSRDKIRQWYWYCVFSESYRDGQGARYAKDIVQVMKWINKREEPEIIRKVQIDAGKLILHLKTTASAAYKGMISIILKNGAQDFIAGKNMGTCTNYAESTEIHHIFPKKYCEAQKIAKEKYDNIANKTLILKGTNRIIGGNSPSVYLEKIQGKLNISSAEVDEILEGHLIDAALCRADDFDAFIVNRAKKILDAIETLTARKVSGLDSTDIKKIFGKAL